MKPELMRPRALCRGTLFLTAFLAIGSQADQLQMQNGDLYFGKVTALNSNSVILQSEVLGNVQLPRAKVTSISLGTVFATVTNSAIVASPSATSPSIAPASDSNAPVAAAAAPVEIPASLQKLAAHSNLVQQVQSKFLGDAGPEANAKFTELMNGLTTGKMNVNDLRAEARSLTAQARELRRGLGDEAGASLDMYLSVLDKFLNETPESEAKAPPAKK